MSRTRSNQSGKLVLSIMLILLTALLLPKLSYAQNFEQKYFLLKGDSSYELTISVTPSLYEYYQQKSHQLTQYNFASFVTPYSLAPVAVDVRSIFPNDEGFVNAVLMLVHQIPYEIVEEARYPVETIVEDSGDCDLLSFVASSLISSQDLNVVLFYYEEESHMNIGVDLLAPPRDARTSIHYVDYRGTRYYMAECTGSDWQNGWRVGECPPELEGAEITVITLEERERIAPGQVSSSFGTLESSAVSISVSPKFAAEGYAVTVTGQVSTRNPGGTVTIYAATGDTWFSIVKTKPDSEGYYSATWTPTRSGQYVVKASWSGDTEHAGADSGTVSVYVVPKLLIFAVGGVLIVTIVAVVVLLMYRASRPQETQIPGPVQ